MDRNKEKENVESHGKGKEIQKDSRTTRMKNKPKEPSH